MERWRGRFLCFLFAAVLVGGFALSAYASDGQWNSVIRPGMDISSRTPDYTVDLLSPLWQTNSSMIFFNPRFRTNPGLNNENELNLGLGYRRLILNDRWYVGGNVFYDHMRSANDFDYNQIGLGLEARSKWFDAIMNGYIQTGKTKHRLTELDRFELGSTALLRHDGFEEAMSGLDGEVGALIPGISRYIETRAYVGGYWWGSDVSSDISGVRARLEVDPVPLVTMNCIYSHDNVRGTVWEGEAYLNIPLSFENLIHGKNPFEGIKEELRFAQGARNARERMTDRVERDRDIQTETGSEDKPAVVHSMIYVNNANTTGTEDGSLEHPYSNLTEAANDISGRTTATVPYIYIFKGNGAYTDGLTLVNNSSSIRSYMVWGEHYTLPGLTTAGYPVLTTTGYPILTSGAISFNDGGTSAGDITVRGLTVKDSGGTGIYAVNVRKAEIYDNVLTHNSGRGIYVYAADSSSDSWNTSVNIHDNQVSGNGFGGIRCIVEKDGTGNGSVTVADNTLTLNSGYGVVAEAFQQGASGDVNVTVTGNTANDNFDDGIYAYAENDASGNGSTTVTISDNQASGSQSFYGIQAYAENGVGGSGNATLTISGNTANNNYDDNILADAENHSGEGSATATITGNQASGSLHGCGIDVDKVYRDSSGSGNASLDLSSNTATGNNCHDIWVDVENDGPLSSDNVYFSGSGNTYNNFPIPTLNSLNGSVSNTFVP